MASTRLGLVFLLVVMVVAVVTPTCCNAARELRNWGRPETHSLSEERQEFEKRSSDWSDQESGDDAVPTSSSPSAAGQYHTKFDREFRYLKEHLVTHDYADTPAAANPSIPCC